MIQVYRILSRLAEGSSVDYHFEQNEVLTEIGINFTSAITFAKKPCKFHIIFYLNDNSNLIVEIVSTFDNDFQIAILQDEEAPFYFKKALDKYKFLAEMRKILLREIEQVTESE